MSYQVIIILQDDMCQCLGTVHSSITSIQKKVFLADGPWRRERSISCLSYETAEWLDPFMLCVCVNLYLLRWNNNHTMDRMMLKIVHKAVTGATENRYNGMFVDYWWLWIQNRLQIYRYNWKKISLIIRSKYCLTYRSIFKIYIHVIYFIINILLL